MKNFEEDLFCQSCENVKDFDRLVKFENEKRTCPLAEKEKGIAELITNTKRLTSPALDG